MTSSLKMVSLLSVCWALSHSVSSAQCGNTPDLVIANAHIITMNPAQPVANTLAIRDGHIQSIGDFEDILSLIPEGCPVNWIDAGGYTVLPGFNDAHSHWLSWPEHICDAPGQQQTTYPDLATIMDTLTLHGWTSISELNFGRPDLIPEHLQHAMELEANGDLHVRINGYWGTYDDVAMINVLQNYGYEPGHAFSDRIRAPGVKIYVDDPFGTTDIMDQATCTQLVSAAHQAGYQVAAHCVNQPAVGKILNAYESALGTSNNSTIRHRVEHAVKVSDSQFQRMENKGILASFQLMGPPDWPDQNTFQTYISNSNTSYILRWKDFVQSNIPIVGSTDAPFNNTVCDYSPFRVIYQAVTRKGYIDRTHASWELNQRINIEDALKLLTIDGAWATKEEAVKGSLQQGKYADLTLVSADPLSVGAPEELLDIHSWLTMVGGEIEYCSPNAPFPCQPAIAFVVDTMLVTVSQYVQGLAPGNALDGNLETNWLAGDYPPQYIQLDLLKNTELDRIELVVDQFPDGFTRHQVLGAQDGHSLELESLHEFAGNTSSLQTLSYNFQEANDAFRYVRIATIVSPSWVSWREIRLYSKGSTATYDVNKDTMSLKVYPNPASNELTVDLYLDHAVDDASITFITMDGKTSVRKYLGDLPAGQHMILIEPGYLSTLGWGNALMIFNAEGLRILRNFIRP